MERYITIHGHFYQPPRENPWLEEVELQDSAYPYHDWNSLIADECYGPNATSRILDSNKKIIDIVNNYAYISFDFGPTLLSWLERHKPDIYKAILDADKKSRNFFPGHGSAIAQAYNHMIMPLANSQDKFTQIIWGMKDFEFRFKRKPEGMWLPETAVDLETLTIMAEQGILFTILAPHQAKRVKKIGEDKWGDVKKEEFDIRVPYLCRLPKGKDIVLFFYDDPISREVAFGGLLSSGENFSGRLATGFSKDTQQSELVNIATDGETYGHHHRFGDMALAYCLHSLTVNGIAHITNYAEFLESNAPEYEVEISENTSWSCSHGVERWKNDCGCNSGKKPGWKQAWRQPLRHSLDWLRDSLKGIYEDEMKGLVRDPWEARNDYIDVILNRNEENLEKFLSKHALKKLRDTEKIKLLKLLESQRHAMLMHTSCGWFFDDISGIESIQVIMYAARAIQLAKDSSGISLEGDFVRLLEHAPSNVTRMKNGARIYDLFVRPAILDLYRIAAHYAISSLFKEYSKFQHINAYSIKQESYERHEVDKKKLALGAIKVSSDITLEEKSFNFVALHLGSQNILCGVEAYRDDHAFSSSRAEIKKAFSKPSIAYVIKLIEKYYPDHNYTIYHLFRDMQREIFKGIFKEASLEVEASLRKIYEHYRPVIKAVDSIKMPLPENFPLVLKAVLNTDIRELLEAGEIDFYSLKEKIDEALHWNVELDRLSLGYIVTEKINRLMGDLSLEDSPLLEKIINHLKIAKRLSLDMNLWESQNIYFALGIREMPVAKEKAKAGDPNAKKSVELFMELGDLLHVRIG